MIKALIFDCFGVFYTDPVLDHMRSSQTPIEEADALHNLDEQAARGRLSKAEFVQQASRLLNRPDIEIEQRFFYSEDRNSELIHLVQELRKSYRVALLSNIGADMMDGFFAPDERNELFDVVVLSGEVGYAKPDPEIFMLACNRLGVSPAETVMIDDVQSNIEAAMRLGMHGIHYTSLTQFRAELDTMIDS